VLGEIIRSEDSGTGYLHQGAEGLQPGNKTEFRLEW